MNNSLPDYLFMRHDNSLLNADEIQTELTRACHKLQRNMLRFGSQFPSACTQNNIYRIKGNDDWTNGFWTGMQAIAYEFTQNPAFLEGVKTNVESFKQRLKDHFILDHHDIGFLYSLSVVADWKITQQSELTATIIEAADVLVKRYHKDAGFIQAWGDLSDPNEYRLIIDSLINLPLLYTASEITQDEKYSLIATNHFNSVINNIFRDDYSSHHTYYFDPKTGKPLSGKTFQGFDDKSCWARGQAWAILGLPLNWRIGNLPPNKALYQKVCDYFLSRLPEDGVPYWDLSFTAKDGQSRDTSALAIVICGLIEADKFFPEENYLHIAQVLLQKLVNFDPTSHDDNCEGLLKHGVYAYSFNKGIDECNLWGDYYYMESLYRLNNPQWKGYW